MNTLIDVILTIPRVRLHRNIRKLTAEAQETLVTLQREKARAIKYGAESFAQLADVGMYLVIMNVDLTIFNFRLLLEHDDIVKNVYSRQLVLIIYELLDDFPNLFGKCLRDIAGKLPKENQHFTQLEILATTIRTIKKRHEVDFYAIRNIVVAHRDMNGEKQLETIQRIDCKTIFSLALDINLWIAKALGFLTMMLKDYQFSRLQLKEIAKKIEQTAGALPYRKRSRILPITT